jgi:hypothetical protein
MLLLLLHGARAWVRGCARSLGAAAGVVRVKMVPGEITVTLLA